MADRIFEAKRKFIPIFMLGVVILLGLLINLPSGITVGSSSLKSFADQIVTECSPLQGAGNDHLNCYNEKIPTLMKTKGLSMEQSFEIIKLVQAQDDSFWYCHVASHIIVANEVAKNPDDWKEVFTRCPNEMCSSGCMHGAFQERFKLEVLPDQEIASLMPELQNICELKPNWQVPAKDQTSCYHGLGHTAMYLTGANIDKSVDICQKVGQKSDGRNYVQTCTEGIFMQLYQPREPEDVALVKNIVPTKDKVTEFCDQYSGQVRAACRRESWVLQKDRIETGAGIVEFCSYTKDQNENYQCLNKMFETLMTISNFDDQKMKVICLDLPDRYQSQCFTDVASRLVTADTSLIGRAVAVCEFAESKGVGQDCYDRLLNFSTYLHKPGSPEALAYCNSFFGNRKDLCLSRNTN